MIGDILLFLLFCMIIAGVWSVIYYTEDNYDHKSFANTFKLICPVCKKSERCLKAKACNRVATMDIQELSRLRINCDNCEADLTGAYLQHPFVKEALSHAENLKGSKELSLVYITELKKLKTAMLESGELYGQSEIPQLPTQTKATKPRSRS